VIEHSCRIKAEIVAFDEREAGLRALLNYGHTFGHAIEAGAGYGAWLHGEAVAAGMVLAASLSHRMGFIGEADVKRITHLLRRFRLPVEAPQFGVERYRSLMGRDKKVESGVPRFILLKRIGEAIVTDAVPGAALDELMGRQPMHV
jgi:3-dehydroquinate synthase